MIGMGIDATGPRTRRQRVAEKLERERIRRELEQQMPAAVCAVCGGYIAAGNGTLADVNPWQSTADAAEWREIDEARVRKGLPPLMGWRRRHDGCSSTAAIVVALVGIDTTDEIAAEGLAETRAAVHLSQRHPRALGTLALRDPRPRPWAHVDKPDRHRIATMVQRAVARAAPHRCTDGPCAWCGVRVATGWSAGPETWADGSLAPFCGDCAAVWARRGHTTDRDRLRGTAYEALTGRGVWGAPDMRAYCDVAPTDHPGTDAPWTYADALAGIRADAAMTTAERDALRWALADEAEAAEAAKVAEAARAAGWPA